MARRKFRLFGLGRGNNDDRNVTPSNPPRDNPSQEDNGPEGIDFPFLAFRLPLSPDTNMQDYMNSDFGAAADLLGGQLHQTDIEAILGMIMGAARKRMDTRPTNGAYIESWIMDAFASEDNPRIYTEIVRLWNYIELDDPMAIWILNNKMMLVESRTLANGDSLELWDFGCITTLVWKGTTMWFPAHSIRWMSLLTSLHLMDIVEAIGFYDEELVNQVFVEFDGFDVSGTDAAAQRLREVIDFERLKHRQINPAHVQTAMPFLDIQDARGITPWDFYEAVERGILSWEKYEVEFEQRGFVRFWDVLKDFDPFLNAYAQAHGLTRRRKMIIRHIALPVIGDMLKDAHLSPAAMAVAVVIISTHIYDEDMELAVRHGEEASKFAAKFYGGNADKHRADAMLQIVTHMMRGLR